MTVVKIILTVLLGIIGVVMLFALLSDAASREKSVKAFLVFVIVTQILAIVQIWR